MNVSVIYTTTNRDAIQQRSNQDQLRGVIRLLHYCKRTEEAYVDWATKFIVFHGKRHPREMGRRRSRPI